MIGHEFLADPSGRDGRCQAIIKRPGYATSSKCHLESDLHSTGAGETDKQQCACSPHHCSVDCKKCLRLTEEATCPNEGQAWWPMVERVEITSGDWEPLADLIYEVANGTCRDIAETIMESDWLAASVHDADDRGRNDHRNHNCCGGGFVNLDDVRRKAGDDRAEQIAKAIEADAEHWFGRQWVARQSAARLARESR